MIPGEISEVVIKFTQIGLWICFFWTSGFWQYPDFLWQSHISLPGDTARNGFNMFQPMWVSRSMWMQRTTTPCCFMLLVLKCHVWWPNKTSPFYHWSTDQLNDQLGIRSIFIIFWPTKTINWRTFNCAASGADAEDMLPAMGDLPEKSWSSRSAATNEGLEKVIYWIRLLHMGYLIPRCSMYGIFTYIWMIFRANVGKYSSTKEHMGYGIQSIWLTVICLLMWQCDTINSNRTIWKCSSFQCHIAMEPMTYSYTAELRELQGLEGTIPFSQSFHGTYSLRPSKSSTTGYKWRICNSQLPYYPLVNTQKAMEHGHL